MSASAKIIEELENIKNVLLERIVELEDKYNARMDEISSKLDVYSANIDNISSKLDEVYLKVYDIHGDMSKKSVEVVNTKEIVEIKSETKVSPSTPRKTLGAKRPGSSKGTPIQRGNITVENYDNTLLITGSTFDRKDLIKKYGGYWSGDHKGWIVELKNLDPIMAELKKYCETVIREVKSGVLDIGEKKTFKTIGLKPADSKYGGSKLDIDLTDE